MYYAALFTTDAGFPTAPTTEVSDPNYARQPVELAADGQNALAIRFPAWSAAVTVSHLALMTSLVGGAVYRWGEIGNGPVTVLPSQRLAIPAEYLTALGEAVPVDSGSFIANTVLSGHRALVVEDNGRVGYAEPTIKDHAHRLVGLGLQGVNAGDSVLVHFEGAVEDASFAWTLGSAIFLGANGALTQTAPTSGLSWKLGVPLAANKMYWEPEKPTWKG